MNINDMMWLPDAYTWLMVGLTVMIVIVYLWWTHHVFANVEAHIKHGPETDPYIEQVRQRRAAVGCSVSVVINVQGIDGKMKRFYYHEGSETRFRMTDDGTLYLDV